MEEEAGAGAAQAARAATMQAAGDAVSAALAMVGARAGCEGEATAAPAMADGETTTDGARQEALAPAAAGGAGAEAGTSEGGGHGRGVREPP